MIYKIKEIIFNICYFLLLIYLIVFLPLLFGRTPLVVMSGSMEPTFKVGGIIYYTKNDIQDFKEGDILVYTLGEHNISHRIIEVEENGFRTKGDNNVSQDKEIVKQSQILGKGTNWCIPFIGYYVDFIYQRKYLIIIVFIMAIVDSILRRKQT